MDNKEIKIPTEEEYLKHLNFKRIVHNNKNSIYASIGLRILAGTGIIFGILLLTLLLGILFKMAFLT